MQKPEEYNNPLFWKWEKEHIFGPFWGTFALILGKNSTKVNIDNFWVVTEFYIYTKNQSIPSILRNRLNGHFWAHFDTFCSNFEQTRVSDKSKLATFFVKSWSLTFMKKKNLRNKFWGKIKWSLWVPFWPILFWFFGNNNFSQRSPEIQGQTSASCEKVATYVCTGVILHHLLKIGVHKYESKERCQLSSE